MAEAAPGLLRRRRLLVAALLIVLVGAVVWLALAVPREQYLAGALSRALGRPVTLGKLEISLGREVEFVIRNLRVLESDDPNAPDLFRVRKARGRQTWPRLFAGQILPRSWSVDQPVLRLARRADADGGGAHMPDLPQLDLDLTRGTVQWQVSESEWVNLRDVNVHAERGNLRTPAHGYASANVLRGDVPVTRVSLDFSGWLDDLDATGRLEGLDIGALSYGSVVAQGRGDGTFTIGRDDERTRIGLDFDADALSLSLPDLSAPVRPAVTQLSLQTELHEGAIDVDVKRLQLDDLILDGTLAVTNGTRGRVSGELHLADFAPAAPRFNALRLMALRFASWEGIVDRIEAGRVEDVHLRLDLARRSLGRSLRFARKVDPKQLSLELRVRDGRFSQGSGSPLENISGELAIRGNVLEARNVHIERDGKPLPLIDATVDGMHRLVSLPREERGSPHGAGVPTPGLGAALAGLGGGGGTPGEPTLVRFSNLELSYPAFLLPLRDAQGELILSPGRLRVEQTRGVLGGAPAEIAVDWQPDANAVAVDVRYLDDAVEPRAPAAERWIDADVAIPTLHLGAWRVDDARFQLRAQSDKVELSDIRGTLDGGTLVGGGSISLASTEGLAPYAFGLQLIDANATGVAANIGLVDHLTGTLSANGRLAGALGRDLPFLRHGELKLVLRAHDGDVAGLPAAVALARLPSLSGVRGLLGRPLPFRTLTTDLEIASGVLILSDFKLLGPELRMLVDGTVDLQAPDRPVDLVVALLFLETVDRLLGSLPIVRDVVLGEDRNLLATYFRVEGPLRDPKARMIAPEAVQTATGVISGGVKRLRDLIPDLIPGGRRRSNDGKAKGGKEASP